MPYLAYNANTFETVPLLYLAYNAKTSEECTCPISCSRVQRAKGHLTCDVEFWPITPPSCPSLRLCNNQTSAGSMSAGALCLANLQHVTSV